MTALSEFALHSGPALSNTRTQYIFGSLREIIEEERLSAVFQPILNFDTCHYLGFEGLIRGPEGSFLAQPSALFSEARCAGCIEQLDYACHKAILTSFSRQQLPGKVFINVTPRTLHGFSFVEHLVLLADSASIKPDKIVLELTESEALTNYQDTIQILLLLKNHGFQIALDDLGSGYASLQLWSELRPEIIKIDQHFFKGITNDRIKRDFVTAMQMLAESTGSKLIAEGLENFADLHTAKKLGINFGQGYVIARPQIEPFLKPSPSLIKRLDASHKKCEHRHIAHHATARKLLRYIEPVSPFTENDIVFHRFEEDCTLDVLPVVDALGKPVGLINRHAMIDRFSRPFRREIYGRKHCTLFMDSEPLVVDANSSLQSVGKRLARAAAHYLSDGFLITEKGIYKGVGSGHSLMAEITEMQIHAARYSNPLTQLPGNVPINEHIDELLRNDEGFVACYFDINHFKPFNDNYGYRKGDEVIQLLGSTLVENCSCEIDFVGHIGGDDFLVLFKSIDWEQRCQTIIKIFDNKIRRFFSPEDLLRNGMLAENRKGINTVMPLTSLSIGAVDASKDKYPTHYEISAAAAIAKKQAKKQTGSSLFIERRHYKQQ